MRQKSPASPCQSLFRGDRRQLVHHRQRGSTTPVSLFPESVMPERREFPEERGPSAAMTLQTIHSVGLPAISRNAKQRPSGLAKGWRRYDSGLLLSGQTGVVTTTIFNLTSSGRAATEEINNVWHRNAGTAHHSGHRTGRVWSAETAGTGPLPGKRTCGIQTRRQRFQTEYG